ncbi:MAG: hypothetical protein JXP34_16170 [Planctomycetes bacterium]|nr:hypothetical protein [Planctomycetota bacterium]
MRRIRVASALAAVALACASLAAADEPEVVALPENGYAEALRRAIVKQVDAEGLHVKVVAIPDAYRYYMAKGLEPLREAAGEIGKIAFSRIKDLHEKYRRNKGKSMFFVSLAAQDAKTHYFLQTEVRRHTEVKTKTKYTIGAADVKPEPSYESWQIFEQRDDFRRVYRMKLASFRKLEYAVTYRPRAKDEEPVVVSIAGLLRCGERKGVESVNAQMRQMGFANIRDQIVLPLTFTFERVQLDRPPPAAPAEFEEILKFLE